MIPFKTRVQKTNDGNASITETFPQRNAATVYPVGQYVIGTSGLLYCGDGATAGGVLISQLPIYSPRYAATVYAKGQLVVDTTTGDVYRGDGSTSGGTRISDPSDNLPVWWVIESSGKVTLRSQGLGDANRDYCITVLLSALTGNSLFDLYYSGFEATSQAPRFSQYAGTATKYNEDDTCPLNLHGFSYIDAGHGQTVTQLAKTSHGLTAASLGKTWTLSGNAYALFKIVDVDTLQFAIKPRTYSSVTNSIVPVASGTVTFVAAAVDGSTAGPGDIASATASSAQAYGVHTSVATAIALADGTAVTNGSALVASTPYLQADETRTVADSRGLYAACIASVGAQVAISDLDPLITRTQQTRLYPWGVLTVRETMTVHQSSIGFTFGNGPIQAAALLEQTSNANTWLYIPGSGQATDVNLTTPSLTNFGTPAVYDTLAAAHYYPAASWTDAQIPPDWMVQLNNNSGSAVAYNDITLSFGAGYDPTYEDSRPASRLELTNVALWLAASTRKFYPCALIKTQANAPSIGQQYKFRGWLALGVQQTEPFLAKYFIPTESGGYLLYLAWNAAPGNLKVSIPDWVGFRTSTLNRGSANTTLRSNSTRGSVLLLSSSDAVGSAIIELV